MLLTLENCHNAFDSDVLPNFALLTEQNSFKSEGNPEDFSFFDSTEFSKPVFAEKLEFEPYSPYLSVPGYGLQGFSNPAAWIGAGDMDLNDLIRTDNPKVFCTRLPQHYRSNKSLPNTFAVVIQDLDIPLGTQVTVSATNNDHPSAALRNNSAVVSGELPGVGMVAKFSDLRFVGRSGRGKYFAVIISILSEPKKIVATYHRAIKVTVDGPRTSRKIMSGCVGGNMQNNDMGGGRIKHVSGGCESVTSDTTTGSNCSNSPSGSSLCQSPLPDTTTLYPVQHQHISPHTTCNITSSISSTGGVVSSSLVPSMDSGLGGGLLQSAYPPEVTQVQQGCGYAGSEVQDCLSNSPQSLNQDLFQTSYSFYPSPDLAPASQSWHGEAVKPEPYEYPTCGTYPSLVCAPHEMVAGSNPAGNPNNSISVSDWQLLQPSIFSLSEAKSEDYNSITSDAITSMNSQKNQKMTGQFNQGSGVQQRSLPSVHTFQQSMTPLLQETSVTTKCISYIQPQNAYQSPNQYVNQNIVPFDQSSQNQQIIRGHFENFGSSMPHISNCVDQNNRFLLQPSLSNPGFCFDNQTSAGLNISSQANTSAIFQNSNNQSHNYLTESYPNFISNQVEFKPVSNNLESSSVSKLPSGKENESDNFDGRKESDPVMPQREQTDELDLDFESIQPMMFDGSDMVDINDQLWRPY